MMVLRVTRMRIMLLSCGNLSLNFHKLSGKISRKINCSFGEEISAFIRFVIFMSVICILGEGFKNKQYCFRTRYVRGITSVFGGEIIAPYIIPLRRTSTSSLP